jgi:hypothetical protein
VARRWFRRLLWGEEAYRNPVLYRHIEKQEDGSYREWTELHEPLPWWAVIAVSETSRMCGNLTVFTEAGWKQFTPVLPYADVSLWSNASGILLLLWATRWVLYRSVGWAMWYVYRHGGFRFKSEWEPVTWNDLLPLNEWRWESPRRRHV